MGLLEFQSDVDTRIIIRFAVTDPDAIEGLPVIAAFLNHEPWSRHEVDALESYARPKMMESRAVNGAAHLGCRKILRACHLQVRSLANWKPRTLDFRPDAPALVHEPQPQPDVGSREFTSKKRRLGFADARCARGVQEFPRLGSVKQKRLERFGTRVGVAGCERVYEIEKLGFG